MTDLYPYRRAGPRLFLCVRGVENASSTSTQSRTSGVARSRWGGVPPMVRSRSAVLEKYLVSTYYSIHNYGTCFLLLLHHLEHTTQHASSSAWWYCAVWWWWWWCLWWWCLWWWWLWWCHLLLYALYDAFFFIMLSSPYDPTHDGHAHADADRRRSWWWWW